MTNPIIDNCIMEYSENKPIEEETLMAAQPLTAAEEPVSASERILVRLSRAVSALFTPFIVPLTGFLALFLFSYLRIMPPAYKLVVLGIVCCFTILLPTGSIYLFRRINGLRTGELTAKRKHRFVPFLLTIISYACCLLLMHRLNIPWYMTGIIFASLLMLVVGTLLNIWWKLSEHMAGAGAILGGLVTFSALFDYNPVFWLSLFILVSGVLGTARITLGKHTPGEVLGGFLVGLLCSLVVLHPMVNLMFRILLF